MALAKEEEKEAVQAFRSVLKDQPQRSDIQALLGEAYYLEGESTLARESLEKAVLLNPQEIGAVRRLAQLDGVEGRRKEDADGWNRSSRKRLTIWNRSSC